MCLQVIGANVTPKIPSELSSSLLPMDDPRCWHCVATLVREQCWNAMSAQSTTRCDLEGQSIGMDHKKKRKKKTGCAERVCISSVLIVFSSYVYTFRQRMQSAVRAPLRGGCRNRLEGQGPGPRQESDPWPYKRCYAGT